MISNGLDSSSASSFIIGIIILNLKILSLFALEILFTTTIEENIHDATLSRLVLANLFLLIAELFIFISLIVELDNLLSFAFVVSLSRSSSPLSLFVNKSGYSIMWFAFITYTIGLIVYLFPKSESQQKPIEQNSLILLLRSLFLPM